MNNETARIINRNKASLRARSRSPRRLLVAALLGVALLLAACGSDGEVTTTAGGSMLNPVSGDWVLQSLSVEEDMQIDLEGLAERTPTVSILGTELSGTTGCNDFRGATEYDIEGDRFNATVAEMTEIGCDGHVEKFFLQALEGATIFAVESGVLTLSDDAEYPTTMTFANTVAGTTDES